MAICFTIESEWNFFLFQRAIKFASLRSSFRNYTTDNMRVSWMTVCTKFIHKIVNIKRILAT